MQFTPRNLSAPDLNLKDSVRNIAEITFRWRRARPEEISSRGGEHFSRGERKEIAADRFSIMLRVRRRRRVIRLLVRMLRL